VGSAGEAEGVALPAEGVIETVGSEVRLGLEVGAGEEDKHWAREVRPREAIFPVPGGQGVQLVAPSAAE